MKKTDLIRLICYLIFVGLALIYPIRLIMSFEYPGVQPGVYRFKAGAYDPYDPLRGRYIRLSLLPERLSIPDDVKISPGFKGDMLAVLTTGEDGFAAITELLPAGAVPPGGRDVIRVSKVYVRGTWKQGRLQRPYHYRFQLPFNRFYLNEELAPKAENLLRGIKFPSNRVAALVKVYANGNFMLEDLLVDGIPIRQYLKNQ